MTVEHDLYDPLEGCCIRLCQPEDAPTLARLHVENMPSQKSLRTLEIYYRALIESEDNWCLCAEADGEIVGYVGVLSNEVRLLKTLLTHRIIPTLACLFARPALALECVSLCCRRVGPRKLSPKHDLPTCEYRAVVVAQQFRSRGVAHLLLAAADGVVTNHGAKEVFLYVAKANIAALRTYEKSGFERWHENPASSLLVKRLIRDR